LSACLPREYPVGYTKVRQLSCRANTLRESPRDRKLALADLHNRVQVSPNFRYHVTMKEFFRGWRRKAGTVTLVIALAMMGLWIRSRLVADQVVFPVGKYEIMILSSHGTFYCFAKVWDPELGAVRTHSFGNVFTKSDLARFVEIVTSINHHLFIPQFSITIPLTLLAAYLLFIPPQGRSTTMSEPHA
jgi:hypothetical protein